MNLTEIRTTLQQKVISGGQPIKSDTLDLASLTAVLGLLPDGPQLTLTAPALKDLPATQNIGTRLQLTGNATIIGVQNATVTLTFVESNQEITPTLSCTLPSNAAIDLPDTQTKLLSVHGISFVAHADGTAIVSGMIGLDGNAVTLPVSVELSSKGVVWVYDYEKHKKDATPLNLNHLIELFGKDLASHLPPPLRTISSLTLAHLEFSPTEAMSPRLVPYLTAKIQTTHPWDIAPGFALKEFDLTVTVTDPLSSSRQFWFEIEGDCQIEGTVSKLIVSGPEGPNRWRLRVEPGLKLEVSKLSHYIGQSSAPQLPTPSQQTATIQLEYLQVVVDLSQGGLQAADLVLSETGAWQIVPDKIELDKASLNLSVISPTDPANRHINGSATALFAVGSGENKVNINLSAQYQS